MPNVPTQAPNPPAAPTGNAITQAQADALNAVNQSAANTASDCLWPPSGQFSIPIIPGIYTQSIGVPCLMTYSEARAIIGVALLLGGSLLIWSGVGIMAVVAGMDVVGKVLGAGGGGKSGAAAGAASKVPAAEEVALAA
jgi:hypothetical protein